MRYTILPVLETTRKEEEIQMHYFCKYIQKFARLTSVVREFLVYYCRVSGKDCSEMDIFNFAITITVIHSM